MPFEDELGRVLRDTAGSFTADRRSLAEGSLVRGRRRLARRHASVIAGSALAVVLVATAGVRLSGDQDGDGKSGGLAATPRPSGDYGHFAVTAEGMKNILRNGMTNVSGIAVGHPKVQGAGSSEASRPATASIDFGDGFGAAEVTLSVRRVDPADQGVKKLITCAPGESSPFEECTTLPDSRAVKGYTEAGKAGGVMKWAVTLLSSNGYLIDVATNNVPTTESSETAPVTRAPRMNPGKLRNLALFVDGSFGPDGETGPLGGLEPGSEAEPGDILPLLKDLLPARLHIYSEGGTAGDAHVVVYDGKSGKRTYIEASRIAGDKEVWNETLADGTKVGTRQLPGRQPGVVQLRADARRVNGLWMSVSAYNAPSPTSKKSGDAPLVTTEVLKAIVISRTWLLAR
ncbi:hypothetical protein [Streptomyces sp. NPDC005859]|uniref:hypothetical protein n=1 Tax=Streptomyces sp. NPDC005859 TaxID=3157170 RepID=UPI0033CDDF9F